MNLEIYRTPAQGTPRQSNVKVAERKAAAGSIIGLAAAVASLKLGPGKGDSGKIPKGQRGRGGRGRGKGRGKGGRRSKPEEEPDMKKDSDEESQLSDEILDSDEEINKTHRAGKPNKRVRKQPTNGEKTKGKDKAKAKAKGKKTGDDNEKPKRSFPKSHLFDEWKKFSNEQKAKLAGKMPYHPMMKEIAKMCLGPILHLFCQPYDGSSLISLSCLLLTENPICLSLSLEYPAV